ncbi:MAG: DUF2628 domain-containing protein [Pseudomonadota bacterium]
MAIYTVWEHDRFDEPQRAERALVQKDGFRFLAFLLGPLWLLFHGNFAAFLLTAVGYGAAAFAAELMLGPAAPAVMLIIAIWFGFEAAAIRRWALARRKWTLSAIVEATSRRDAVRRYLEGREADGIAPSPMPPVAPLPAEAPPQAPSALTPASAPWGPRPQQGPLGLYPEGPR